MQFTPAYWLLADDVLPTSSDPKQTFLLRAALKYALLYDVWIVISDSDAINNRNLRRLVLRDREVQQLFRMGLIRIARRELGGVPQSLVRTWRQFKQDRNNKQPRGFPNQEYDSQAELEFLDEQSDRRRLSYSLRNVALRYTNGIRSLFETDLSRRTLGDPVAAAVRKLIDEQTARAGEADPQMPTVNYAYMHWPDQLGADLDQRLGPATWAQHGPQIQKLAKAPYVTALPEVIQAHPVYADLHAESVDIWRGRVADSEPLGQPFEISLRIGLDTYVRGLTRLKFQDILELRRNREYAEFMQTLHQFDNAPDQIESLKSQYIAYQRKIEERILQRLGTAGARDSDALQVKTSLAWIPRRTSSWIVQETVNALAGKFAPAVGLLRTLTQPDPEVDPANPGRIAANREAFDLEMARQQMIEDELKIPLGRIEPRTMLTRDYKDVQVNTRAGRS